MVLIVGIIAIWLSEHLALWYVLIIKAICCIISQLYFGKELDVCVCVCVYIYLYYTCAWFKNITAHISQLHKYFTKMKWRNNAAYCFYYKNISQCKVLWKSNCYYSYNQNHSLMEMLHFSMARTITRTGLDITLHMHCPTCYIIHVASKMNPTLHRCLLDYVIT
jgi:hypothetical protein